MAKTAGDRILDEHTKADEVKKLVEDLDFETAYRLLEQLVQSAESGSLSLERAVVSCERGSLIASRLKTLLTAAEERLQILPKP